MSPNITSDSLNAVAQSTSLCEELNQKLQILLSQYVYEPESDLNFLDMPTSVLSNDDIPYEYETRSQSNRMTEFLQEYTNGIKGMFLTHENTDEIFRLSIRLIEEFTLFCQTFLNNVRDRKSDILKFALKFVRNKLLEDSSSYKRHQKLVKSDLFVAPQEKAIGTHWEMVRDKSSNLSIPRLLQSRFHYISIIGTIHAHLKQNDIREMYFQQYFSENSHVCAEGVYKHFCCSSRYKSCDLFTTQPHALQLQIATDDYENCDALGSK